MSFFAGVIITLVLLALVVLFRTVCGGAPRKNMAWRHAAAAQQQALWDAHEAYQAQRRAARG
jgi:hypothetical protein